MKEQHLTIQDIANMTGVAKSTVSRYLNGGKISAATSEKIRIVIEEHQYKPNAFAQSLKAKSSKFIGIVAPCLDSVVTSRVIMVLDQELKNRDYNTLILNTSHNKEREVQSLQELARLKVDGIILVATEITPQHEACINKLKIPVVVVGQQTKEAVCIINNDYEAGKCLGRYIYNKGHRRVLYIGVGEEDEAVGQFRKQGVLAGLQGPETKVIELIANFSAKKTEQLMMEKVDLLKEVTAIVCATDNMALAVLKVLNKQGKSVPHQMALAGFGGYEISRLITPTLTTIRFDYKEAGKKITETIIQLMGGEQVEPLQEIGFDLIEGESV